MKRLLLLLVVGLVGCAAPGGRAPTRRVEVSADVPPADYKKTTVNIKVTTEF